MARIFEEIFNIEIESIHIQQEIDTAELSMNTDPLMK